ncbi:MAG TPA: VCBS repeat-containing protein, partial [Polyangium sp.]|nr:VCBS repeat-containing protein [Polyangium sp.]
MNRRAQSKSWRRRPTITLVLMMGAIAASMGCGAESGGNDGGAGGAAGANVGQNLGALPSEVLHDARWDAPHEVADIVAPPSNATPCTANNQCPTGFCVDGFCCDAKCDYPCMACSAAKKGSGVDGVCGAIAYDTDPDNDCPLGACDGKNQCKNYNGVACTSAAGCLSNYCVDGYCCGNICMGACQACSAAKKGSGYDGVCGSVKAATDPDNECNPGECNGSGACNASPQAQNANGVACTSAAQCQSGYCADGVCCDSWCLGNCMACSAAKKGGGTDGVCGFVANDKDDDNECWAGACNGAGVCKQYNGLPCTDKSQCLSNYCADGVCCGNICNQFCTACTTAKKGYGYDGVCEPIASGRDLENECNPGECNGAAACNQPQTPQANGTTCASGGQCASGHCVDGVCCDTACAGSCTACTAAKKGGGVNGTCGNIAANTDPDKECGAGRCGGNGLCRYYNGAPCTSTAQCFSNYCADGFCCGNICTGSCMACSNSKKGYGYDGVCENIVGGRDPDNECNPGECSGSGACNQPQTPQPNGAACLIASQCVSGFCIDGVCCDKSCSGLCEACTTAKKGGGANGTCGPIANSADPDNECTNGECSGAGTCKYYNGVPCTSTAECISNYCADGFCCGNICNLSCMACSNAKKGYGFNGVCENISNGQDPDNECGLSCNGSGACVKAPNGTSCSSAAECTSGHCIDGVCCNNACTGACNACDVPGSIGTCTANCAPPCTGTIGLPMAPYTPMTARAGTGSVSSAVGDLNGDGFADLAVASESTGTVRLMYNVGDGHFASAGDIAVGQDPRAVAIADLDIDGDLDVAVASYAEHLVSVLYNQGNGAFAPRMDYPTLSYPHDLVIANLDGDGLPDVVTSHNLDLGVLLNQGNQTFAAVVSHAVNHPEVLAAADVNNDGWDDMVCASEQDVFLKVLINQGNGTFAPPINYNNGSNNPSYAVTLGDLNGDAWPDLVQMTYPAGVRVMLNQGNGAFAAPVSYATNYGAFGLALGDVDADGKLDVITSHSAASAMSVLRNQGNGALAGVVDYSAIGGRNVHPADFNLDGTLDIATVSEQLEVLPNPGNGIFAPAVDVVPTASDSRAIVAADFNGDGQPDVGTGRGVLVNQGNGVLGAEIPYSGNYPYSFVTAANFNADNMPDLAAFLDGNLFVRLNLGAAAFGPATTYGLQPYLLHALVAGDFNADNNVDLALGLALPYKPQTCADPCPTPSGCCSWDPAQPAEHVVQLFMGNGNGTFQGTAQYVMGAPTFSTGNATPTLVAADFNGDGDLDLAYGNTSMSRIHILNNQGN